ncbi:stage II sporulation protein R [Mesobacillus foraminis]|uniref:stage II sporulation protein R n=1 Tax=Mesobacillus foraminis TaxID=279826 RepID=UPI0039A311BD
MKKKMLAELYLILLCLATILSLYMPQNEATAKDPMVIPSEAIRLRILADSDSSKDQEVKRLVRDAVNAEITKWVEDLTSMEDARALIQSRLPEIQQIAEKVVASQGSGQSVKTEFGKVEFPTKLYGQFLYPAGEYEAILITLGEGKGANWWCVLYPPLCFLDFSNGEATSEGFEDEQEGNEGSKVVGGEEQSEAGKAENVEKIRDKNEASTETKLAEENQVKSETQEEKAPLYEANDEEPAEVRFFLVDIWNKIFS